MGEIPTGFLDWVGGVASDSGNASGREKKDARVNRNLMMLTSLGLRRAQC